ncbi:DNA translocase FtsK [Shouchella clausii]|uniref:DNA translocase FtsK n=1 Tax=Shouchella clausii TaxID=79880 RepID=UPI0026FACF29|nr:DNA translocase FtsK [Shouchella clausii]MDO7267760.1 DNA translocase FtsK [Shouchella clausii]MDO7287286.1 DNA translocase FtsK [Shouchella clausii]
MNIWKKWLDWVKGLNEDDEEENNDYGRNGEPIQKSIQKLERENNELPELEEARMTYRYANSNGEWPISKKKAGRVAATQPPTQKKERPEEKRDELPKVVQKKRSAAGKELFQGTFKSTEIPSPVHGIQKPEKTHENSDYDWLIFSTKDKQAEYAERLLHRQRPPQIDRKPAFLRKESRSLEEDVLKRVREHALQSLPLAEAQQQQSKEIRPQEEASGDENERTYKHEEADMDEGEAIVATEAMPGETGQKEANERYGREEPEIEEVEGTSGTDALPGETGQEEANERYGRGEPEIEEAEVMSGTEALPGEMEQEEANERYGREEPEIEEAEVMSGTEALLGEMEQEEANGRYEREEPEIEEAEGTSGTDALPGETGQEEANEPYRTEIDPTAEIPAPFNRNAADNERIETKRIQPISDDPTTSTRENEEAQAPSSEKTVSLSSVTKKQDRLSNRTSNDNTQPGIPYNVLMLPKDRKKAPIKKGQHTKNGYEAPPLHLLKVPEKIDQDDSLWLDEQAQLLEETLSSFHVDAKVVNRTKGPAVTRFEVQPARGVKVNKVTNLTDDIKLALAAKDIRMEAPIPGKNAIGIEVPNRTSAPVMLREILRRDVFRQPDSPLTVGLGLDISGQPIVTDLKKMPHGLVAGATGSGKSVCINSILVSLLYKASPDEVKLLLVDPKMVELATYQEVPHLVAPVITDPKQATAALKWVVQEMERRYELFSQRGVRDISKYNQRFSENGKPALPYLLVVIDELADLMMVSPQDVEDAICRIAQKARACGIHLLLATQRPSVDVITGLIKANIPTRIAFAVASQTDSRTILDMGGAERLLGKGDMLFHENGSPKPIRVQGTFVSDEEIEDVVAYAKQYGKPEYLFDTETIERTLLQEEEEDELLEEACFYAVEQGTVSASSIQRRFRVGYNRAARLMEMMEARKIVSGAMGSKPRHVLASEEDVRELFGTTETART